MKLETYIIGPLSTNCYIITADNGDIAVIDPGYDCEVIRNALAGRLQNIKYILLTHAHADHIMGLAYLIQNSNATVLYHPNERERLTDSKASLHHNMRAFFKKADGMNSGEFFETVLQNSREIKDGDTVTLGEITLKVLHTSGHTDGSVCYVGEDFMFSGDTLFQDTVGRTDLPSGNADDMMRSLSILRQLPHSLAVYSGHGDATTLQAECENNPYMRQL